MRDRVRRREHLCCATNGHGTAIVRSRAGVPRRRSALCWVDGCDVARQAASLNAMSSAVTRVWPFWWIAGLAWGAALTGVAIACWSELILSSKERLPPIFDAIVSNGVLLCGALFVVIVVWLVIARPLRGVRNWGLVALGMVLTFVPPSAASLGAFISTSLFSGSYMAELDMPSEFKTHYLYQADDSCGYKIYTRYYGSIYLHHVRVQSRDCEHPEHAVGLLKIGDRIEVVDDDGEPVASHNHHGSAGFYWGPR